MKDKPIVFKKLFLVLFGSIFRGVIIPAILVLFVIHSARTGIQGDESIIILAIFLLAGSPKALYNLVMTPYKITFDTNQKFVLMKSLFSTRELQGGNIDSFVLELRIKNRDPWLKIRCLEGKEIQLRVGDWREQDQFSKGYYHWTHNLSFLKAFVVCIGIDKLHGIEELKRLIQAIVTEKTDSGFECYLPDESKKLIAELELGMRNS